MAGEDGWSDCSIAILELTEVDREGLHFTQIGVPPHRHVGFRVRQQTYWAPMQDILGRGSTSTATRANTQAARESDWKVERLRLSAAAAIPSQPGP